MIYGREITPESLRGLWRLGKQIQREVAAYLRHWDRYMGDAKAKAYVETMTNIWKEIQIIGYHATDEVVREAFASL